MDWLGGWWDKDDVMDNLIDASARLKTCPFCRSKASVVFSRDDQNADTYCVACDGCSCSIGEDSRRGAGDWADSHDFRSEADAVAAWNKRSGDA